MTCGQCTPEDCTAPKGWVCKTSGNFYTTGEYSRTIEYFGIHGASFNQKVDSVKMQLDNNTIQILKVLLTEVKAPVKINPLSQIHVIQLLDYIQSRLSNDNILDTTKSNNPLDYPKGDDEQ